MRGLRKGLKRGKGREKMGNYTLKSKRNNKINSH